MNLAGWAIAAVPALLSFGLFVTGLRHGGAHRPPGINRERLAVAGGVAVLVLLAGGVAVLDRASDVALMDAVGDSVPVALGAWALLMCSYGVGLLVALPLRRARGAIRGVVAGVVWLALLAPQGYLWLLVAIFLGAATQCGPDAYECPV